jgi:hypothetical protein
VEALESVIKEWSDCMMDLRQLTSLAPLSLRHEHFSTMCDFAEPCGAAVMALYMLLTATRKDTTVGAVGFFYPDDYESTYRTHRGPGESKQYLPEGE